MRLEVKNHEWELNGDMDATVFLDLAVRGTVNGLGLGELDLIETELVGVTFAIRKHDIVCDGQQSRFGQPSNCDLPDTLKAWFVSRFLDEWTSNSHLRESLRESLEQSALAQHYDQLAAA